MLGAYRSTSHSQNLHQQSHNLHGIPFSDTTCGSLGISTEDWVLGRAMPEIDPARDRSLVNAEPYML
jgi:hypothetical protein